MSATARVVPDAQLAEHSPAELRIAYHSLPLARAARLTYDEAMADPLYSRLVRARARDLKNRARAQKPSGYRPGLGDLAATVEATARRRKRETHDDNPQLTFMLRALL